MCLVAVAVRSHARYPLILLGNRDEWHARPAAPAGWWADRPGILGGRDLQAMGTWLAVDRHGRFAVVTNQPSKAAPAGDAPSRGQLAIDFLSDGRDGAAFLDALVARADRYAGFRLLVGDPSAAHELCEPNGAGPAVRPVRGIATMTNAPSGEDWPKSAWLAEGLRRELTAATPDPERLLELLDRREPVSDSEPRPFSATPFIVNTDYGTRASSLLLVDASDRCLFVERRFGAGGEPAGESRFEFALSPPAAD